MAEINWDDLSNEFGGKYKDYCPAGIHTVVVDTVEHRTASTGTVWEEFKFEDSDQYAFPKVSHPVSSKNAKWRQWHWKELFVFLGATEENAKKAVASCESKTNFDQIAAAYLSAMERLVAKHPTVEIEAWKDGKYMRADFNARVRMSSPDDEKPEKTDDPFAGATEATDIDAGDIPF